MSRVGNSPVVLPAGVDMTLNGQDIQIKGPVGSLAMRIHDSVAVEHVDNTLVFTPVAGRDEAKSMYGTMRACVNNMVVGVSEGFTKQLELVGVGYRAQAQGNVLNLTLGFSHPVAHAIPEGITVETPSQTVIIVKGADKQVVGQVSAEIRAYRPPEPYKGKGVRYSDEVVVRKEAKKK